MPLGAGYSVQRVRVDINRRHLLFCTERREAQVESRKPERFCTPMDGIGDERIPPVAT